jgi:FkbM family methyltransferase
VTSISYAQNFEDVMLSRALGDIEAGFYVDVGAQDPVIDSVTRMFYERGWKGINIEPVPHWFERLQADRPRDINLMCAVAASEGTLVLHEFADSGLSTASEEYARNHAAAGRDMVKRSVPAKRLDQILAEHAPEAVHFLKIDVEGMEQEVLAGLSLDRYRPWILVIEATQPNTAVDVSQAWEMRVLSAGYRLVYRDGLNRFYLAEEQMSRARAFDVPPNVFDDFIPYREHASNEYAQSLEGRLQALHDRSEELRRDLIVVTDSAMASQRRLGELEAALQQRQALLEETARTAEAYRVDLLAVTEAAQARQQRLMVLEATLLERQSLLEETARTAEKHRIELTRQAAEQQVLAAAAENRRILIADLEARLGQRDDELRQSRHAWHVASVRLEGLQRELETIYASRSWRLTAPLRSMGRLARRIVGHGFRAAAQAPVLRKLGSRILTGRLRRRVLSLAGFVEQGGEPSASVRLLTEYAVAHGGQRPLSRAGARVYRLLASARGRDMQGPQ